MAEANFEVIVQELTTEPDSAIGRRVHMGDIATHACMTHPHWEVTNYWGQGGWAVSLPNM